MSSHRFIHTLPFSKDPIKLSACQTNTLKKEDAFVKDAFILADVSCVPVKTKKVANAPDVKSKSRLRRDILCDKKENNCG